MEQLEWDQGLYAEAIRRAVELAAWLNGHSDGWTFSRADVLELSSWSRYADLADSSFNMAFDKAREAVRVLGLEIESADGKYRKRKRIRLTAEERQALLMALAVADPGELRETAAIPFGLGIDRRDAEALLDFSDDLDVLLEGLKERRAVEISHRGRRRQVDPYGIGFRNGRWYLVGRDHTRDRVRVFGLGRSGPDAAGPALIGKPRSFDRPTDLDTTSVLEGALDPARWNADAPVETTVRIDGDAIGIASRLFGTPDQPMLRPVRDAPETSEVDTLEIRVVHLGVDALVRAMLALRTHAVVLDPPEVVEALCEHLRAIAGVPPSMRDARSATPPALASFVATSPGAAGARLVPARRLEIITTALALGEAQEGVTHVDEVARVVNATPEQVAAALNQLVYASFAIGDEDLMVHSGVGLADDGVITVIDPWLLDEWQPTLPQALRLFVAAKTALALAEPTRANLHPTGAADARLRLACDKLAGYLAAGIRGSGGPSAQALRQFVEVAAPTVPESVRKIKVIVESGRTIRVVYRLHDRTVGEAEAELDPVHVRFAGGRWVLEGRLRAHRIRSRGRRRITDGDLPTVEGTRFVTVPVDDIVEFHQGRSDAEFLSGGFDASPVHAPIEAKIELDADKLWLLDPYPLRKLYETRTGRFRATAVIPNLVELRTLMLRVGVGGRLRSPKELREMPATIAREILALYGR